MYLYILNGMKKHHLFPNFYLYSFAMLFHSFSCFSTFSFVANTHSLSFGEFYCAVYLHNTLEWLRLFLLQVKKKIKLETRRGDEYELGCVVNI